MNRLIRHLSLSAVCLISGLCGWSQLVTTTGITPTSLVEDVLVGSGVVVSGVTYTGHVDAIGSFDGSGCNIGLNSGILLTTGTVKDVTSTFGGSEGPQGPNDSGSAGTDNGKPGYGPLTTLAGSATYNAAVLEFDFVPQADSVHFRYVFGSEEYPEFVDGGFNDAFAFFISGPGFGGTYNMALIPGGGGIVSIDNVNNGSTNTGPCQNCAYYHMNGTGSTSPYMDSDFYVQYDGFTVVLTASAEVQCGETYHLKIAIADAGDGAYDSGIFLEANSLASNPPITMEASLAKDAWADGSSLAEGCETATVTVTRTDVSAPLALTLSTSGSATEGVDYDNIPPTVNFATGVATATFIFDVNADFITEGAETVVIELATPSACGTTDEITLNFVIKDVNPLTATVAGVSVHCPGEEVELTVVVSGGLPDYTYNWAIGGTDPSVLVSPLTTTSYSVTVNDDCIGTPVTVSGTVTVPNYPPMIINTTPDTSVLCPNTPIVLVAEVSGGEGSYDIVWYDASGAIMGGGPILPVHPMVTTTYTVGITDGCGTEIQKDITVTVIASVLELEMSPEILICPGDSAEIWVIATEGLGDYTYNWLHSGETTSEVTVSPDYTHTYTVSVEDACHTYDIKGTTTVKVIRPHADFYVLTDHPMENLMVNFGNLSTNDVAWAWDFDNGDYSADHSPNTTYNDWGWFNVTLVVYNEIGCTDTVTKPVYIHPEYYFYVPNAFTPDGNEYNNTFQVSSIGAVEFELQIFNRWGERIYTSYDPNFRWDGSINGHLVPDDVVVWKALIVDLEGIHHTYEGTVTILR